MHKKYTLIIDVPEGVGGEHFLRGAIERHQSAGEVGIVSIERIPIPREEANRIFPPRDEIFDREPTYQDDIADATFFTALSFGSHQLARFEKVQDAIDAAAKRALKSGEIYHVLQAVVRVERDTPPVKATQLK